MNRYANNTFDFIRGWKNAVGTVAPSRILPGATAVTITPVLVAQPAPTSTSASTPTPPVSSNTSSGSPVSESGSGGSGGGSGSGEKEGALDGSNGSSAQKGGSAVADKVKATLGVTAIITGLFLIGMNVKKAFQK